MSYKTLNQNELKEFINGFHFPNPNWENLPAGFPNLLKTGLTKEENHLLDGIILAWCVSEKKGKVLLLRNSLRSTFFIVALLAILSASSRFIKSPEWRYTKEISAATISATLKTTNIQSNIDEINLFLESTMSASLKRKAKGVQNVK